MGRPATVTVCIPTILPRSRLLARAIGSVMRQERLPDAYAIAVDHRHEGAAVTRNRSLKMARTEWVAFMDDDDELYPQHLARLLAHATETGADVVWPWFDVEGGHDPFPQHFGRQYDPDDPHLFPITTLVRRRLAVKAGGFPEDGPVAPDCAGEDWPFWLGLRDVGARFAHLPERTWRWWMHDANTSGVGSRW